MTVRAWIDCLKLFDQDAEVTVRVTGEVDGLNPTFIATLPGFTGAGAKLHIDMLDEDSRERK